MPWEPPSSLVGSGPLERPFEPPPKERPHVSPDVVLFSDIPASHAAKAGVEAALRETLQRVGGRWRAEVLLASATAWWTVSLEREGVSALLILLGPAEQTPDRVVARLREMLFGCPPR
jgi:hypothetical protein